MNHPNPNLDFEALLNRDPIAIFSVLKLSKQVYAEVDVGFVSQFFEGLFAINSLKELDFNRDDLFLPFHSRSLMPKLTKVWEFVLNSEEKKRLHSHWVKLYQLILQKDQHNWTIYY
ncbi:hypothetical protein QL285_070110 [Trifolium repens]|nr:hypothetical protein QL285_070110 [Trifolium repens]